VPRQALETLLSFIQNYKSKDLKAIGIDLLKCLSQMKPAFDALKVANSEEKKPFAVMDPETELTCRKMAGLFFESLPSGVIQMYAIVTIPTVRNTYSATPSILLSVLCR